MTPAQEIEHLRFVNANQAKRIVELERDLARAERTAWNNFELWRLEVRPGWQMWRVRRRREAVEKMRTAA